MARLFGVFTMIANQRLVIMGMSIVPTLPPGSPGFLVA
jgi:hypothetical protein